MKNTKSGVSNTINRGGRRRKRDVENTMSIECREKGELEEKEEDNQRNGWRSETGDARKKE